VQSQLEAAKGDARTRLSSPLCSPGHWVGGSSRRH
jgi:hypothetical protein